MSRNPPPVHASSRQVIDAAQPDGLASILEAGANLASWCRPFLPAIPQELASLEDTAFPHVRRPITADTLEDDVAALLRGPGFDARRPWPAAARPAYCYVSIADETRRPRTFNPDSHPCETAHVQSHTE